MSVEFHPPAAWRLTGKEAQFLNALLLSRETLTKKAALDAMYDGLEFPAPKIIDVFACRVRQKLAHLFDPDTLIIETVWGRGYRIDELMKAAIRSHDVGPPPQAEEAA